MFRFRSLVVVSVYSQCAIECGAEGMSSCPCVATAKTQYAAKDVAAFIEGTEYGYGCKLHDDNRGSCVGSTVTGDGQTKDWCKDQWCIVDPNNCDLKARLVTYSRNGSDYFSYETCDTNFAGNGWVGRQKCNNNGKSYCTSEENTQTGHSLCPCIATARNQTATAGKTEAAFVTGTEYGYGCKYHDDGKGSCKNLSSTRTSAGAADDWCKDKWCIVDPNNCNLKSRAVTFTQDPNDHFSYKTCDTGFVGNGWVGRLPCTNNLLSYCSADENAADISASVPLSFASLALVIALMVHAV